MKALFLIVLFSVSVAISDDKEDKEIVKDLDFFVHMDTVENAELMESIGDEGEDDEEHEE